MIRITNGSTQKYAAKNLKNTCREYHYVSIENTVQCDKEYKK